MIGLGLAFIALNLSAQTPTVSLSLNKTSMSEAGGTATYRGDYEATFVGKDEGTTLAGGMVLVLPPIN